LAPTQPPCTRTQPRCRPTLSLCARTQPLCATAQPLGTRAQPRQRVEPATAESETHLRDLHFPAVFRLSSLRQEFNLRGVFVQFLELQEESFLFFERCLVLRLHLL